MAAAKRVVEAFGGKLAYARVDGILHQGQFLLMELELIEPDLYFDYHPEAMKRFFRSLLEAV
ncbi:MAG: hypothetical protein R2795_26510 [Saprospiraceae bacterium]